MMYTLYQGDGLDSGHCSLDLAMMILSMSAYNPSLTHSTVIIATNYIIN